MCIVSNVFVYEDRLGKSLDTVHKGQYVGIQNNLHLFIVWEGMSPAQLDGAHYL